MATVQQGLVQWLESQGGYASHDLTLAATSQLRSQSVSEERGIRTTAVIPAGARLLEVPLTLCLHLRSVRFRLLMTCDFSSAAVSEGHHTAVSRLECSHVVAGRVKRRGMLCFGSRGALASFSGHRCASAARIGQGMVNILCCQAATPALLSHSGGKTLTRCHDACRACSLRLLHTYSRCLTVTTAPSHGRSRNNSGLLVRLHKLMHVCCLTSAIVALF